MMTNLSVGPGSNAHIIAANSDSPVANADMWLGQSQLASQQEGAETASIPNNKSRSPRKKQEPHYLKRVSGRQPMPKIKRNKGQRVPAEPFEIMEPEEFKHVNKTRKV